MKELKLLVWLTQLGLSVAVPPLLMVLLGLWIQDNLGWGCWVLWLCVILGIVLAIDGLYSSLREMVRLAKSRKGDIPPQVSFNDHS